MIGYRLDLLSSVRLYGGMVWLRSEKKFVEQLDLQIIHNSIISPFLISRPPSFPSTSSGLSDSFDLCGGLPRLPALRVDVRHFPRWVPLHS